MDQFSTIDIFNTSIRDLPRPRLIQKRRNLLTLLNGDAFYPLSTWPQDIQQLFWKKPIGDTDTFKLMLFFLGNGCSKHLITEWILTSQHWTTLQKGIKRARQINFIINKIKIKTAPSLAAFKASLVKNSKCIDSISFGCSATGTFKNPDDFIYF